MNGNQITVCREVKENFFLMHLLDMFTNSTQLYLYCTNKVLNNQLNIDNINIQNDINYSTEQS